MSTKIFNGLMLHTANTKQINDKFDAIREEVSVVAKNNYAKQIAKMYVESYDGKMNQCGTVECFTSGDDSRKSLSFRESSNLICLLCEIMEYNYGVIKKTCGRNPVYDFNLEIFIYPFTENITLFNPRYEQVNYREIIEKHFNEYAYWDSIDKPREITEEEWGNRHEAWNSVLNWEPDFLKWELYSNQRDVFNLFKDNNELKDLVIQNMPSVIERAYKIVWQNEVNKNLKRSKEKINVNNVFSTYMRAEREAKKCDGRLKKEAKEYSKIMEEITLETVNEFRVFKKEGK